MPVNGLMVTLSSDPKFAEQTLEEISGRGDLEMGVRQDRWLPLVVDTEGDREARDTHRWLEGLPGVDQVEVILVGFEEDKA